MVEKPVKNFNLTMEGSAAKIPKPMLLEGNIPENFRKFKQQLLIYLTATGLSEKSEEQRVAILLNIIGEECLEIFNNFTLTEEERKNFDKVLSEFEKYMLPKKNLMYERFVFYTRGQEDKEPIDNYVNSIKKLAKSCEFKDENEMVRDRLVLGIRDKKLQEK